MTAALAGAAGVLAALGIADVLGGALAAARRGAPSGAAALADVVDAVLRLGREGREPGAIARRRLLAGGGAVALALGALVAGPAAGLALGAGGPLLAARLLRARRERYRRAVAAGAPALALALADALAAGRSLRGAVTQAAAAVPGAAGHELRRVAAELDLGARTDEALDAMARRAGSHAIELVVAACVLQRRAGGDLARLLRDSAAAFEDHARLEGEVRAATAQARYTAGLVAALPAGAAGLAALASPGFVAGLLGSPLAAALVATAVALQLVAWVAIRRLAAVRW
jgi:tight adherence protein B